VSGLGSFRLRQAVFHRTIQVVEHTERLGGCDQGAHSHQAPVPRCESRAQPQFRNENVGWCNATLLALRRRTAVNVRGPLSLRGFVQGQQHRETAARSSTLTPRRANTSFAEGTADIAFPSPSKTQDA